MEMTYDHLDTEELRGTTQADYLIALDAELRVVIGDETVFAEPGFPVVELARSLRVWLSEPIRRDFEFDSMSLEEVGSIAFRQTAAGWEFGSVFVLDELAVRLEWADVEACSWQLIARVEEDLANIGLNPREVLKP